MSSLHDVEIKLRNQETLIEQKNKRRKTNFEKFSTFSFLVLKNL